MLPMPKVLDILRHPHIFCLRDQEEKPETIQMRNTRTLKASCQKFRHFQHLSVTGPHQAVSQIQELCRQWLQPETHTKEQMIEQLVLEQFLSTLPVEVQTWVRSKRPKNSKEAGTLVANLIQACNEEVSPAQNSVCAEKRNTKENQKNIKILDSLQHQKIAKILDNPQHPKNTKLLNSLPSAVSQEMVTFKDVIVDFSTEELNYLGTTQRNLFREVTLENYRNLIFLGYKFSKPDIISRLEEEESHAMEGDSNVMTFRDGEKRHETKELTLEQYLPVEKSSLKAATEEVSVGNVLNVFIEKSSEDPSESHQGNQEKLWSPVTISDLKTLSQERSHSSDEFEKSSDHTKKSSGSLGKHLQECSTLGMCISPQSVNDKPFLQENKHKKCKFCKRAFNTQTALGIHEKIHIGKKPFECKQCGKAFCLVPQLIRHQRTHSSDKPSESKGGGKSFIQHANLCVKYDRQDYYECFQCGKAFIQEAHLFQHLKAHEAAKFPPPRVLHKTYLIRYQRKQDYVEERACQCCDCGKAFNRSSHLIQHYRIHALERAYQCQLCGKCFSRPSYLTQHYQLHSKEKPVEYNHC